MNAQRNIGWNFSVRFEGIRATIVCKVLGGCTITRIVRTSCQMNARCSSCKLDELWFTAGVTLDSGLGKCLFVKQFVFTWIQLELQQTLSQSKQRFPASTAGDVNLATRYHSHHTDYNRYTAQALRKMICVIRPSSFQVWRLAQLPDHVVFCIHSQKGANMRARRKRYKWPNQSITPFVMSVAEKISVFTKL